MNDNISARRQQTRFDKIMTLSAFQLEEFVKSSSLIHVAVGIAISVLYTHSESAKQETQECAPPRHQEMPFTRKHQSNPSLIVSGDFGLPPCIR